ncbi:MAG: hypothetical protein WC205_11200 [Opitutaceae bacterium]|jgi:hypothetical protein
MINQPKPTESGKVTIEDLLRLKRAERPAPEFWTTFEQELRVKQLAAIVEKRQWWVALRLPQAGRTLARFQVPMGAAAVLALSFVVVNEYRSLSPAASVLAETYSTQSSGESASAPVVIASSESTLTVDAANHFAKAAPTVIASIPSLQTVVEPSVSADVVSFGPGDLTAMIPWAATSQAAVVEKQSAPSVTLGELSQVHFASVVNPGRDHDFDGQVELDHAVASISQGAPELPVDVAEAVEPVVARALPTSTREMRRNRILASLVVADSTPDSDHSRITQVREVLASTLDDGRLYDTVSRIGMGGDRLTLKF